MIASNGPSISYLRALLLALGAVACFQAAYAAPALGALIFGYVVCLCQLARMPRPLHAFAAGFAVGLGCVAPQLSFFYGIFGTPAIALWAILAAWVGLFVALLHLARRRLGPVYAAALAPFLWTGLEYFRSEVYALRFPWLNVGFALSSCSIAPFRGLGIYGIGFLAASLGAWTLLRCPRPQAAVGIAAALVGLAFVGRPEVAPGEGLSVAGVQMEEPSPAAVLQNLDALARAYPQTPLYVMSEYTFDGPVPDPVKAWCRSHGKYLIAGGKATAPGGRYYNTAFVIGPSGAIVFSQAKSMPIQFFDDGLPAPRQDVWESPWGRLGICICYDLSYRRVTDRLVALGARALIVPTMDAESWGAHEHVLHTRIAPVRAAEYGIPVFRLASSGVSQAIDARGSETARAPFPGDGAMISARLHLGRVGALPWDRALCWVAMFVTAASVVSLPFGRPMIKRADGTCGAPL